MTAPFNQMRLHRFYVCERLFFRYHVLHRFAERTNLRHALGAGAQIFLLPAAEAVRQNAYAAFHVQRTHALRRMYLVARNTDEVSAVKKHSQRSFMAKRRRALLPRS